jgi:hypothetical protein
MRVARNLRLLRRLHQADKSNITFRILERTAHDRRAKVNDADIPAWSDRLRLITRHRFDSGNLLSMSTGL